MRGSNMHVQVASHFSLLVCPFHLSSSCIPQNLCPRPRDTDASSVAHMSFDDLEWVQSCLMSHGPIPGSSSELLFADR